MTSAFRMVETVGAEKEKIHVTRIFPLQIKFF